MEPIVINFRPRYTAGWLAFARTWANELAPKAFASMSSVPVRPPRLNRKPVDAMLPAASASQFRTKDRTIA